MHEINGLQLQNSLGRVQEYYREEMKMNGFMALAKVLKVHHKHGTADVELINSGDRYTSSEQQEGKFSAKIMNTNSHYDGDRKKAWGTIEPIAVGSLVLVTFLENMKHRPVILGTYQRPDNIENIYSSVYPIREWVSGWERREALKSLTVYPSQAYKKVDGEGNIEISTVSKSFFVGYNPSIFEQSLQLNDRHGGFDHKDLSEVDKRTGTPYEADWPELQQPMNFLFVHRTSFFDDSELTWTKFFLEKNGMFRITRDTNDEKTLSFIEVGEDGKIIIKRQLDSPIHHEADNFTQFELDEKGNFEVVRKQGENHSKITVSDVGDLMMERVVGGKVARFKITEDGTIEIETTSDVNLTARNFNLYCDNINKH